MELQTVKVPTLSKQLNTWKFVMKWVQYLRFEEEDSVMESGITDSENTETNSDINSDRRSMMMESRIYSQIIMKKRLNQIKEKSQRLHIRKELVLSYE